MDMAWRRRAWSLVGLFHFWSSMSTWSTLDKGKRSFVSYPYRTTIRTVQHVNIQIGRKRQSRTEGRGRLRQPYIIIGAQAEMDSRSIVATLSGDVQVLIPLLISTPGVIPSEVTWEYEYLLPKQHEYWRLRTRVHSSSFLFRLSCLSNRRHRSRR